jgi:hypothetical protein
MNSNVLGPVVVSLMQSGNDLHGDRTGRVTKTAGGIHAALQRQSVESAAPAQRTNIMPRRFDDDDAGDARNTRSVASNPSKVQANFKWFAPAILSGPRDFHLTMTSSCWPPFRRGFHRHGADDRRCSSDSRLPQGEHLLRQSRHRSMPARADAILADMTLTEESGHQGLQAADREMSDGPAETIRNAVTVRKGTRRMGTGATPTRRLVASRRRKTSAALDRSTTRMGSARDGLDKLTKTEEHSGRLFLDEGKKKRSRRDEDEEDEERDANPSGADARKDEEDDEERPHASRDADEDDDEDERPRRKRRDD